MRATIERWGRGLVALAALTALAACTLILRDALIYERDILNRNR